MNSSNEAVPQVAIGASSVLIGTIGMLIFFLPILCVPLALCGLALGVAGILVAAFGKQKFTLWPILGIVVSCAALGTGLAMNYAPQGYIPSSAVPRLWRSPPNRPFIPPPANGAGFARSDEGLVLMRASIGFQNRTTPV